MEGRSKEMVASVLKPRQTKQLQASKRAFRNRLRHWFREHGRDYPWRRTRDPYEILVSEVMLQQTQINTVLGKGYYPRFLTRFPDVASLSRAADGPLLKAWEGLGYYRRARMLRDTARAVMERHQGVFPDATDALLELPGIGKYTAGALRAFAFELPAVLVDGNVSRVIVRLMDEARVVDSGPGLRRIWELAAELADDRHPREYHSALMELGQRICRPTSPDCLNCPVSGFCATRRPGELPNKRPRAKVTRQVEHAIWLEDGAGRILMHREAGSRRTGLWKLPLRDPDEVSGLPQVASHDYSITRYRVELRVHQAPIGQAVSVPREGDQWIEANGIDALAMAAPFRKVVERLLDGE